MKKWSKHVLGLLCTFILMVQTSYGQTIERPIYIGDIIELEIDSTYHTRDGIELAFSDFEIISLEEQEGLFVLKIRSFEVGEKEVNLDGEVIQINIQSTLDQNDTLIESAYDLIDVNPFPWELLLGLSGIVFILSVIWTIKSLIGHMKKKPQTPIAGFKASLEAISTEDSGYIWQLTTAFKSYLYYGLEYPILGMTTSELVEQLASKGQPDQVVSGCETLLKACDSYKYAGESADEIVKKSLKDQFLQLVEAMDQGKEVVS